MPPKASTYFATENCCYCLELKIGCYIITIFSVIYMVPCISGEIYYCYNREHIWARITIFFSGVIIVLSILASLFFVYGLCRDKRLPTYVYMMTILLSMSVTVSAGLIVMISKPIKTHCADGFVLGLAASAQLLTQSYCLFIVNSLRIYEATDRSENR